MIDPQITLAGDVGGQVGGKAIGVVELEHRLAPGITSPSQTRDGLVEDLHALLEGLGEALLLQPQHPLHLRLAPSSAPDRPRPSPVEGRHQRIEEGLMAAQLVAVADGAADDPPQHIAAPLVGGQHPVGDQKGAGANMVGDDPQRLALQISASGELRRRLDQLLEQIDLVVAVHPLHHRGQPLQAHAGIHRRLGQRGQLAVGVPVVLHEHQVPDLDVAVAVLFGRAGRATPDRLAMVVEDLGTGPAGTSIAHGPEVVALVAPAARLVADAGETRRIDADLIEPDRRGLVVIRIDRDPQLLGWQTQGLGQKFPGILDRILFEIVAEAEVAQHLEKGVMTGGIAHILQIIVFAAGPYATLGAGRAGIAALVPPQKHILELDHARIGEQQGRIVQGHEGTACHHLMAMVGKIVQKGFTNFGAGFHVWKSEFTRRNKLEKITGSEKKCPF